ncbi:hypothetical protein EDD11_008195 [Mortierella claussenii]|nr:hypothetical protein EDD11_008195 [Mortierella claussenii]
MDSASLFSDSALEMFDTFGPNPFVVSTGKGLNSSNALSSTSSNTSSKGCLDTSNSNHIAITSALNNNNNNNNTTINNNTSSYWDFIPENDQIAVAAAAAAAGLDLTPELSPSMSLCSPAVHSVNSPYGFDGLGFDDFSPSPSVGWESPFEQSLTGVELTPASFGFDFDFDFCANVPDMSMADFQLFPDTNAETTSLKKLLMAPPPAESESPIVNESSPLEAQLDDCPPTTMFGAISPADLGLYPNVFSTAKSFGHNVLAPNPRVAPRKPIQSPTKPGFQPNKKRRRRRITSEEAARVIPDECKDDPYAKARYKCDQCDKTFSRPYNLRSHRSTHLGVKPFTCPHKDKTGSVCNWTFARRHDLERHVRSRHLGDNIFSCRTCGVKCTRSDALKRHLAKSTDCAEGANENEDQDMDQVSHL